MKSHDRLCPCFGGIGPEDWPDTRVCQCDLIGKADARAVVRTLDKAREAITALACPITVTEGHCEECEQYREALACIDTLRGES